MTKQELKERYSEWNVHNASEAHKENAEIFHKLQELNYETGGDMWCSITMLIKDLVKSKYCQVALDLYDRYRFNEGRIEAVRNLAIATKNFEIKK